MAAKKGPNQLVGLKCDQCDTVNYVSMVNKQKLQLKGQTIKDFTFSKYCNTCRQHHKHVSHAKLK